MHSGIPRWLYSRISSINSMSRKQLVKVETFTFKKE